MDYIVISKLKKIREYKKNSGKHMEYKRKMENNILKIIYKKIMNIANKKRIRRQYYMIEKELLWKQYRCFKRMENGKIDSKEWEEELKRDLLTYDEKTLENLLKQFTIKGEIANGKEGVSMMPLLSVVTSGFVLMGTAIVELIQKIVDVRGDKIETDDQFTGVFTNLFIGTMDVVGLLVIILFVLATMYWISEMSSQIGIATKKVYYNHLVLVLQNAYMEKRKMNRWGRK